jgi:outer membrane receptor protein involved in Fe transport
VSTGFRVGITQTALSVFALSLDGIEEQQGLDPDSLTNYEVGLKTRLADRRVQLGLNLYRIDFEDVQLGLTTSAGIAAFANVGDAKSTGVDLEVQWETPIEGLSLAAIGNWNDSEYTEILPQVSATLPAISDGERLTNTTEFNYRFDVDYNHLLGDALTLVSHASASTTSSRIMSDGYEVDSYSLYDASIGVRSDRWEATLFGENLADERGPAFVRNQILSAGPFPRTVGLRLRYHFD